MAQGDEYKGLTLMADDITGISASRDGAIFEFILNGDYIFKGVGNEFSSSYSTQSLVVTVQSGMGVCGGRQVTEKTEQGVNSSITLPPSSTGYLVIRVNPLYDPVVRLVATSNILHADLNKITELNAGRDLPLYAYVTNDSGIVTFVDIRPIYRGNDYHLSWDGEKLWADFEYEGSTRRVEIKTRS